MGLLGLWCPQLVAPRLQQFADKWSVVFHIIFTFEVVVYFSPYIIRCISMQGLQDTNAMKAPVFRGMNNMIKMNPNGILYHFLFFCSAINSWITPPDDLKNEFHMVYSRIPHIISYSNLATVLFRFCKRLKTIWGINGARSSPSCSCHYACA